MLVHANILQPLIDLFEALLVFFHDNVGLGWGASIIAMTLLIRFALLPRGGEPVLWDFGSAARHHQLYNPWLDGAARAGMRQCGVLTPGMK